MPSVRRTYKGRQVQEMLARIGKRLGNLRPVLQSIAEEMFRRTRAAFQQERSPEGVPWPALTERYARRKRKRFRPRKKLVAGGTLLRGIHRGVDEARGLAFVSTLDLPYARIHQLGGRAGRGRRTLIPARPFLPSAATTEKLALEAIEESFSEAIGGAQ